MSLFDGQGVRFVEQPKKTPLCGACCFSMIVDITLEECLEKYDWYDFTTITGFARHLLDFDVILGNFYANQGGFLHEDFGKKEGTYKVDILPILQTPCLLCTESINLPGCYHWLLWTGTRFLDPTGEDVEKLKIIEVWPLTLIQYQCSMEQALTLLSQREYCIDTEELKRIVKSHPRDENK